MAAVQYIKACRYSLRAPGNVHIKHQNMEKRVTSLTVIVTLLLVPNGLKWVPLETAVYFKWRSL